MAESKPSRSSDSSSSSSYSPHESSSRFFIQDQAELPIHNEAPPETEFVTPNISFSSTPKRESVVSFSRLPEPAFHKRHDSRVSVQSALRKSTVDIEETATHGGSSGAVTPRHSFMPPRPLRYSTASGKSTPRMSMLIRAKIMRSTMLIGETEKPWLGKKDSRDKFAYWIVYVLAFLGIAAGAARCYLTYRSTLVLGEVCLVMEDNFDAFDTVYTWTQEVSLSGSRNHEFEMTTSSPNNSFVQDGHLFILPTLTSDIIGRGAVIGNPPYIFNLTDCPEPGRVCSTVANASTKTVIPPVMSARLSTKHSHYIQYGKVEIVAKLPRGDWLWPSFSMLPVNETYGEWPRSGEIDIMQARGNGPEYPLQGVDYVSSGLGWGPSEALNGIRNTFGIWTNRRKTFADGFHTYVLEWSPKYIRVYVDHILMETLFVRFDEPFFKRGKYPSVIANASGPVNLEDPWIRGTRNVAPFDQPFYFIMSAAVGGTNGWFPDGVGDKPWFDESYTPLTEFALAQSQWYESWPESIHDRALIVDSVKMWRLC